jgi:tripartite-type tricarboxylate transporter receptor subunit TctC
VTIIVPFRPAARRTPSRAPHAQAAGEAGAELRGRQQGRRHGTIGAGQVKRAPADGYTLLLASLGPYVIAPHLIKPLPYDPLKDFDLLTVAVRAPNVLVVPATSPLKSVPS